MTAGPRRGRAAWSPPPADRPPGGVLRLLGAVVGLAGLAAVLWWAGAALPPPSSFDRTGLEQWLHADPAVAAFAGLRLLGLVLVGWVTLTGAVGLVVHRTPLRRWGGLRRAVDRLCLPVVRRLVHGAAGGALSVAVLVPASTALAASVPPVTIADDDTAVAASASTPGGVAVLVPVEASPTGTTPSPPTSGLPSTADDTRQLDAPTPIAPTAPVRDPGGATEAASAPGAEGAAEVAALEARPTTGAQDDAAPAPTAAGPIAAPATTRPAPSAAPAAAPDGGAGPTPAPATGPHQAAEPPPARAPSEEPPVPASPHLEVAVLVALDQPLALPPPQLLPPVDAPDPPDDRWVVQRGEHLWHVSEATLERRLGAAPSDEAVAGYLQVLIAANRDRLVSPDDPDLVFAGQELVLPPTDGAPTGAP